MVRRLNGSFDDNRKMRESNRRFSGRRKRLKESVDRYAIAERVADAVADMDWMDYVEGNYETTDEAWKEFVDNTYQALEDDVITVVDTLEDVGADKSLIDEVAFNFADFYGVYVRNFHTAIPAIMQFGSYEEAKSAYDDLSHAEDWYEDELHILRYKEVRSDSVDTTMQIENTVVYVINPDMYIDID